MNLKHLLKVGFQDLTGFYIYKKNDLPVGVNLKYDLNYKLHRIDLKLIFDVGANLGQTALKFASDFPNAKIYSFEPVASTYRKLVENTRQNSSVSAFPIAFGDKNEKVEISIFDEKDSGLNSLVDVNMNRSESSKKETITVRTIDDFVTENKIEKIDLLKIDTEGFEINVLNGATKSMETGKIKMIYVEVGLDNKLNNRHLYFADIQQYLSARNFVFFGLYEITHSIIHTRFHFANALYIHESCLST